MTTATIHGSGLIDRSVVFVGALRQAGLSVSLAESLDAVRAMAAVPLLNREALRAGFAAAMVKRPAHRLAFDTLFDLYFPAVMGDGIDTDEEQSDEPSPYEQEPVDRDEARQALLDLLLDGDDEALRRLSARAAARDPAHRATSARPRRTARLPSYRPRVAREWRRTAGDQAPAAQAAQAGARRALRREWIGHGVRALHRAADLRAA